ncbi:hypothetical protein DITRI_Ditri13aG0048100 [Diplodiscus trichospermus]
MNLTKANQGVNGAKVQWTHPPDGVLKFNVDGAAIGKPRPARNGVIFKDDGAKKKIVFSKSRGVVASNLAELLAMREAFELFLSSLGLGPMGYLLRMGWEVVHTPREGNELADGLAKAEGDAPVYVSLKDLLVLFVYHCCYLFPSWNSREGNKEADKQGVTEP